MCFFFSCTLCHKATSYYKAAYNLIWLWAHFKEQRSKTLRVNKPVRKTVKLQVPPLSYKINAHNMSGVRS